MQVLLSAHSRNSPTKWSEHAVRKPPSAIRHPRRSGKSVENPPTECSRPLKDAQEAHPQKHQAIASFQRRNGAASSQKQSPPRSKSIRAGLQAEKQERVQAAEQNETQKYKETCDAILVTKSGIPDHGATFEHARMALSEALKQGILKVHSIKGQTFVSNEEGLGYAQAKMDVSERDRQSIALKDELEKLVYIQMMVRRRFLSTYKRKKLSRFENFDRHAIETVNQIVHPGDACLDATLFRDFGGERTDTDVFKKMYGLTPAQALKVEHQPTIEAMNRHASQIASEYTDHYNSQIEASFHKFIKSFADSGFDDTYLEKDTATHAAYKEFWHDCL